MIYLVSPDNTSIHGGIKIINYHARLLAQHGYQVKIVEPNASISSWMVHPFTDVISFNDVSTGSGDIIVVYWNGEDDVDFAFRHKAKRFFVALNTQPPSVYKKYGINIKNDMIGESVFTLDWDGILCSTDLLIDICREYGKDATKISIGVDTDIFKPSIKKYMTAAYMPRRGFFVDNNRRFLNDLGLILIPIENQTEEMVAKILSESEFFLSITTGLFFDCESLSGEKRPSMEGWNMPVHEAMACGCLVTGFKAYSAPFMSDDTCYVVKDYDECEFRDKLKTCIEERSIEKKNKAIEVAQWYSLDRMYKDFIKGIDIWQT